MNTIHKKPEPLFDSQVRAHCPVCGHVSYSSSGIHPQCAMQAADKVQIERLKAKNRLQPKAAAAQPGRFEKQCPKCRTMHHIRKQRCECGHSFLFKSQHLSAE